MVYPNDEEGLNKSAYQRGQDYRMFQRSERQLLT